MTTTTFSKLDKFFAIGALVSLFVALGCFVGFVNVLVVLAAIVVAALVIAGLCWLNHLTGGAVVFALALIGLS